MKKGVSAELPARVHLDESQHTLSELVKFFSRVVPNRSTRIQTASLPVAEPLTAEAYTLAAPAPLLSSRLPW